MPETEEVSLQHAFPGRGLMAQLDARYGEKTFAVQLDITDFGLGHVGTIIMPRGGRIVQWRFAGTTNRGPDGSNTGRVQLLYGTDVYGTLDNSTVAFNSIVAARDQGKILPVNRGILPDGAILRIEVDDLAGDAGPTGLSIVMVTVRYV